MEPRKATVDDFGGVEFPTVQAFTFEEGEDDLTLSPARLPTDLNLGRIVRNVSLPGMVKPLSLVFETENTEQLDGPLMNKKYFFS